MKQVCGIWLPDGDEHFAFHFEQNPRDMDGAGQYQIKKIDAALACCPISGRHLAIDVGAHVGLWSRALARSFAEVVAFEPVPDLADCFDRNLAGFSNCRLERKALSSSADSLRISVVTDNSGNCAVSETGDGLPVLTARLDDYEFDRVELIKIDVEGWELPVLQGAKKTIRQHHPVIVVEQKHHGRYGFQRLAAVKQLQAWGARLLWQRAGDYCLGW